MVIFFYWYLAVMVLEFLLVSNLVPAASVAYSYFAAVHVGATVATFWTLLLNGFVGFQLAEDGTRLSVWSFRISSVLIWAVGFFIAIATFNGFAGMSPTSTWPLYIIFFLFNLICVLIYSILQVILVFKSLDDRWPLGDIFFGFLFFAAGVSVSLGASSHICNLAIHYVDGMFFGNLFVLLAVMMVYKYWDSITKEDLEFTVGGSSLAWDLKKVGGPGNGDGSQDKLLLSSSTTMGFDKGF